MKDRVMSEAEMGYRKVRDAIQHPHLNPAIRRSTILAAADWVFGRWGKNVDYGSILVRMGVKIIEE